MLYGARGINALVIVDDYLIGLGVALARKQHVGTRILKHRHQVRQHETLRKEILDSLPEA